MTKEDIIGAAFKVWGRDLYRTTSLTEIARELRVSKPALYRHFKDKDALLETMDTAFFNDCAGFTKTGYKKAINAGNSREALMIWIRTLAEYYVRNREAMVFSLFRVYNSRDRKIVIKEFHDRDIDFEHPALREDPSSFYPFKMQFAIATLFFCVAQFHRRNGKFQDPHTEDQVKRVLFEIEERITKGLGLDARKVAVLNYQALELKAFGTVYEDTENNTLLRAVAEAVAEAGPWDASMEMVARRSGLSKSGLYAHFKNKNDMLARLFITEFSRILNFAKTQVETTEESEEQLYLAIISIVGYLHSRPEILVIMDWIKTERLELGKEVSNRLNRIIRGIKLKAIQEYDIQKLVFVAKWILFMIVNTLAWWPQNGNPSDQAEKNSYPRTGDSGQDSIIWAKNAAEIPNESFRILFRFIALGFEGLNK